MPTSAPPEKESQLEGRINVPAPRLEYLDGLRGLAALYVVLFHLTASRYLVDATGARLPLPLWLRLATAWMQYGHYAVAVFIVLSGYSLMLPVALSPEGQLRGGWQGYLQRRARRILPPYYAALLLSLFCLFAAKHGRDVSWGAVWSHLLLVHNLHPDWNMAINIPLWSVATEWDIYFLFPLLLLPLWKRWGVGATIAGAFLVGWLPHFLLPASYNLDWACPWYLGLFGLGMGAAIVHFGSPTRLTHKSPVFWNALAGLFGFAFPAIALVRPLWPEQQQWGLDALVGAFAACLILACTAAARQDSRKHSLLLTVLEHPWTLWLGAFSYSLYLTHILVKWGLYALLSGLHLSPTKLQVLLLVLGVPASLAFARGFYLLVERRFVSSRSTARRSQGILAALRQI